jgi:hypothetical protein
MGALREFWGNLSSNGRRGVVGGGIGVLAVALVAAIVVAGGGDEAAAPTTTSTTTEAPTTTTTTIVTTTTEPATGPVAPLTGLRVADPALVARPALAMKVDNLDAPNETAVPQLGLLKADVVFEEIVEGNITRLVAVYHSQQPGRVGPIRSARTTDVQLLPQLGRPLLGWSGGNDGVVAAVRSSPSIIDAGWDAMPGSYARSGPHRAPHNLYATADELWAKAPADTPPPVPLFQYRSPGQELPPEARQALGVDLSWGGGAASAAVSWRWDSNLRVWVRSQAGRFHVDQSGQAITAKNVVVLVTAYGQSAADSRSPEAQTVGSGELFAYVNGRVIHGRWDRPDINKPATLVDDAGRPVLLSPGQTWIELPRSGGVTTIFR